MTRPKLLPRAAPESRGVSATALLACVDALDTRLRHLHSLMVVRRGHVVAEGWWAPYRADRPHALFSLSKSVTSTAIGLLVEDGLLALDDRVVDLLPDAAPPVADERLATLRLRHLLSMSTGQAGDGLEEVGESTGWARQILGVPVTAEPGTRFMYQTGATYLLAAIATRVTGERLLDHLTPRLLAPLGIEGATWERSPDGIDVGGFGLSMTTEDVAAFGQLCLQRGRWHGQHLVPEAWVATATATQVSNGDPAFPSDWTQGYGFQFWRSRHGGYRGDGAFGQLCLVLPEQEVVVAVTAGLPDMQDELDVIWETLLPALGHEAVPPDPNADALLAHRLGSLCLPTPAGVPTSPWLGPGALRRVSLDRDSMLASLELWAADETLQVRLVGTGLDVRVSCGHDRWVEGGVAAFDGVRPFTDRPSSPLAGAYAWTSPDLLEVRAWATDTSFAWHLDVVFGEDGRVVLELRQNVAFTTPPVLLASGVLEPAA
ncbi:MAG: serine hydrolase domain-containing protein [Chloroflexota bacterium]